MYSRSVFLHKESLTWITTAAAAGRQSPRILNSYHISARCANSDAVPDTNVKFLVPFQNRSKIHRATDRHLDVGLNVDVILRF